MVRYSPRTGQPTTYQPGPWPHAHLYIQWGGKLPGGETWSCGFRMKKTGITTEADAVTVLPTVSAAILAYHTSTAAYISGAAKLSFVKCNAITTAGLYMGAGTTEALHADVAGGGGSTAPYPNQIALAITLTTGYSRGPAHKGRFYMPLPMFALDAGGLISDTDRDYARTTALTLRTAVNGNSAGYKMYVLSRKAGAPADREVTGIEVGRVYDTQRRRRRSLVEAHE